MRSYTKPINRDVNTWPDTDEGTSRHTAKGSTAQLTHVVSRIFLIALGLWLALVEFPLLPGAQGVGLGASWIYGLNLAHERDFSFGTDVVFPYGPLSYLIRPDPQAMSAWLFFTFLFGSYALLLYSLYSCFRAAPTKVAGALICFALVLFDIFAPRDTAAAILPFLAMSAAILARKDLAVIPFVVTSVCTAFLLLTRFNEGAIAYVCLCFLIAWKLYNREVENTSRTRWLLALVAVAPVAAMFVVLCIQPDRWHAVWGYVRGSFELARGYNQVMGGEPPRWQWKLALWTTIGLFTLLPLVARKRKNLLPGMLAAAPLAYLFYKHATTRGDHVPLYQVTLAGLVLLPFMCAACRFDRVMLTLYWALNLTLGILIGQAQAAPVIELGSQRLALRWWLVTARASLHPDQYWTQLRNDTETGLKSLLTDSDVSRVIGSGRVDVVPTGIDYVRANHWNWKPRPVIQSYSAYTPYLDGLNATLFASPKAADQVLLHWQFIDGRLPFVDDVASWRSLINWYDVELVRPEFLILKHRSSSRFLASTSIGKAAAHWNIPITVPAVGPDELLLMRADIKQSAPGKLKSLYLGTAPVNVEVTYSSGRVSVARTAWPNLTQGALLSSLPERLDQLGTFFGPPWLGVRDRVVSLRFLSPHLREFAHEIPIRWEKMSFGRAAGVFSKTDLSNIHLRPLWVPGQAVSEVWEANISNNKSELLVHATKDDPHFLFAASGPLNNFKTLMIRAKFPVTDRIDLGFADQSASHGISGDVPVADQWFDVYINVGANPNWARDVGTLIRFDPPGMRGAKSTTEILGVWGSEDPIEGYAVPGMFFVPSEINNLARLH